MRCLLLLPVLSVACAPSFVELRDAGRKDAGQVVRDAGQVQMDASAPDVWDSGPADTGSKPKLDAGTPADSGVMMDAGQPADAGGGVDAGTPAANCAIDLTPELTTLNVPGLSAGIIKNGRLVCTAVAGQANIEQNVAATPDTVFPWASVSKAVTAVAVMMLVEDGAMQLDDDINTYLPFSVRTPDCPSNPITFRQLLTHTSSILDPEDYDSFMSVGDSPTPQGVFVRGYLEPGGTNYNAENNFDYECPGSYLEYTNVGVGLLGHLVSVLSGQAFDQFLQSRVFGPLGMTNSSFSLAGLQGGDLAMPYSGVPGSFVPTGHVGWPTYADGGLRTSVPQLAQFLIMMAGRGTYQGQRLLQTGTVQEMLSPQITGLDPAQGLLWYRQDYGSHTGLVGHDGGDPGSSALMFFDPASGAGVLLVANGDWYGPNDDETAVNALFARLFDEAAAY